MTQTQVTQATEIDPWDTPLMQGFDAWVTLHGTFFDAASKAGLAFAQQSAALARAMTESWAALLSASHPLRDGADAAESMEQALQPVAEPACCGDGMRQTFRRDAIAGFASDTRH